MLGRNVEFDFSGLDAERRGEGFFYETRSLKRVIPAPGLYRALLYPKGASGGKEGDITVEKNGILTGGDFKVERAEFLSGQKGPA
jgi:hypothetical protein